MDAADVSAAAVRIAGVVHRTPVLTSRGIDSLVGAKLFFKCENLQRTGACKARGAFNALLCAGCDSVKPALPAFLNDSTAQRHLDIHGDVHSLICTA